MTNHKHFEIIIIGGSYAGLAAAMATGRASRKVLVIDNGLPCNRQTPHSHNFLTQDGKTPQEIASLGRLQVSKYNTVEFVGDLVIKADKIAMGFEIQTLSGQIFSARKLIFATGIKDKMPDIPGVSECWGISVLHCPYCHGYEVKNKITGILGNGEAGFEMAKLISNWTDHLTLFTNGRSGLSDAQTASLKRHKIDIIDTAIAELDYVNGQVQGIKFKDGSNRLVDAIYSKLPFEQHCRIPEQLGCALTDEGYIKIDGSHKTTLEGVFACGDNVTRMRTVANAIAMGTTTGMMVNKELIEEKFDG